MQSICPLTWWHVLCDVVYTVLIALYCVRWQRQLLVGEARPDKVRSLSEIIEACSGSHIIQHESSDALALTD